MTAAWRGYDQPNNDGLGSLVFTIAPVTPITTDEWKFLVEEDLLLTGVRSFDVKAFDPNNNITGAGYYDLGYLNHYNFTAPGTATTQSDLVTFGHEGRIPPRTTDHRLDAHFPNKPGFNYIGDDQAGVVRMRRIFDTWSTAYSAVPASPPSNPMSGPPWAKPAMPSYPAPYPMPLRGIQIQIRVVDPKNERIKSITIRQDFTDKL
jgi:hypothetical protein